MNIPIIKRKPIYKVVRNNTNKSLVIGRASTDDGMRKRYCRVYNPGKMVNMVPGSFGIFGFNKRRDAVRYRDCYSDSKIIRVLPVGKRMETPREVPMVYNSTDAIRAFMKGIRILSTWPVDEGTVCYPAVYVMEE